MKIDATKAKNGHLKARRREGPNVTKYIYNSAQLSSTSDGFTLRLR
jgi:hypothetical protein